MFGGITALRSGDIRRLAEALRSDPKVLDRLAAAAERNEQTLAEARAAQSALAKAEEERTRRIEREDAERARKIEEEDAARHREIARQQAQIDADRQEVAKLKERAAREAAAATALRRDFEARLAKIRDVAAAA
jgi:hypothetical protein